MEVAANCSPTNARILARMDEAYGLERARVVLASPRKLTELGIFDAITTAACHNAQQSACGELQISAARGEFFECLHIFTAALRSVDKDATYDISRVAAVGKDALARVEAVRLKSKKLFDAACVQIRAALEGRRFVHEYNTLPKLFALAQGGLQVASIDAVQPYEHTKLFTDLVREDFLAGALVMYAQHRLERMTTQSNSSWLRESCFTFGVCDDEPKTDPRACETIPKPMKPKTRVAGLSSSSRRITLLHMALLASFQRAVDRRTEHKRRKFLLQLRLADTRASTDIVLLECARLRKEITQIRAAEF